MQKNSEQENIERISIKTVSKTSSSGMTTAFTSNTESKTATLEEDEVVEDEPSIAKV